MTPDPLYRQPIAQAFAHPVDRQHLGRIVNADEAYRVWMESGEWSDRKKFIRCFYQAVVDDF